MVSFLKGGPVLLLFVSSLVFLSTLFVGSSEGVKILSISFFSTKSHKIVYEPLLHEMAARGHEVTMVSPIKSDKQVKNVRHVQALNPADLEKEMGSMNFFELRSHFLFGYLSKLMNPFLFFGGMMEGICRKSYAIPAVQEIMKEKFDLVMFPPLFNECLYGLIHKMNVSTILISQIAVTPWIADTMGTPSPPSFVPLMFFGFSDDMTFAERFFNFIGFLYINLPLDYVYYPRVEKVYREVLGDPNLPSIREIERNSSIVLCNSHVSLTKPRPELPDIIDVGGLHLKPAKPVPKELDDFLSGNGEEGFIYFSMGSALKATDMPESYRKMFLNVFSKLKQRVIWKWETEEMPDLPKNVKLSKWLPQQDVLGHPRIRLFITHGGHGSTQESIYHGVPLVAIPMLADQGSNMQAASRLGFAIPLEFTDLTENMLADAINKVLQDPSYKVKAKELSDLFHDQIQSPMDRAVYWTEYVIRHGGARHLASSARNLSFIQYHSIDVILVLLLAVTASTSLTVYINYVIFRALLRKCKGSKQTKGTGRDLASKKKKKN